MYLDARLWRFTKGLRHRLYGAVGIGLLSASVGVLRLILLGWLLGLVFDGAALSAMWGPIALVAGTMVLRGALEYSRNMVAHRTSARVQMVLRQQLYERIVHLGPAYFGLKRTGDVLVSLVEGVEQLETYFGQYLPQLFVAALTPFMIFGFIVFLDPTIATCFLSFAIITLFAPSAFHFWDRDSARARSRSYGAFAAEFLDSLQGLGTLKAFGQSHVRAQSLADKAHKLFRDTLWVLATNALGRGITDTGIALGAAGALAIGAWQVSQGETELWVLLVVLMLGVEVFRPLRDLRNLLHQGMVGQSAAEGILNILAAEPSLVDDGRETLALTETASVEFRDVRFAYPGTTTAAHDGLNFTIHPGQRIGIVGPSGAGKTTIQRLLLRLYDPDLGQILIAGHDIRKQSLASLRQQFAVVQQDTYLFFGTVEDNIRLGKPDASTDEVQAAAKAANATDFIKALPQGYDTIVGERGLKLSGGQRQRIAIARALLRDAPILVLDEALSSVDAENEAVIQQALDRLMAGRTTLIFAHRLSSVIDADNILVLDGGRITEQGRHSELMARGSIYHRLMAAQAQDKSAPEQQLGARATADERPPAEDLAPDLAPNLALDAGDSDAILRARQLGWAGAFATLLAHIKPWKGRLVLTFIFGVSRVAAYTGIGIVGALAVAAVKLGQPYNHLLWILAAMAPLAGILHWLESWIAHDMAFRLLAEMRIALFEKLDKLAPAYLLGRRTGDLVSVATQDVETVEFFFAHTVAPAFVAVLVPLIVLVTLSYFGAPMALALAPFLLIVGLSPFLMRGRVDRLGSAAREALGELNAHAVDSIQGLTEVVAFQAEDRRGMSFMELAKKHIAIRLPFFRELTLQTVLLEMATGLGGLAVVATGASLVNSGSLPPEHLPLLTLLAMAAFLPISEIANIGRQLADTLGATRRLYAVHEEPIPVQDGPGVPGSVAGGVAGGLAFHNVDFRYGGTKAPALADISFTVPMGSTLALVGPSGAGKTTIAHLFMRFWDPDKGRIELDGHDLRDYHLDAMRQRIALVAQDTYLFNDTLGANISIARPEATADELAQAIRRAALDDFIAALPDGLETPVGERGMRLSGGQRQRVAIARAFLKDAPVLILDEATSHLDAVNEQMVRGALDELMAERTTIVIAHRLSTVRDADHIVVLEAGEVVEQGRHDQLIARGGLYAHLVARQTTTERTDAAD
ncbi:MAG: ABC transporter ATP-binding protein [Rhodospirillaceae bacterium]|jgi:ATP-binding cassette, subfamily B, bacterial|nr:ABC transporter ATP-binding protein [Rhodospirillaceae bacterium]MBT5081932.1 ABC transporter ATP-binding protein [Rhodospirillaceae bacterium]MBT5523825.1 ABC transporter ATP-binding protein [Rhodospirillaceae bacterium]MBT5879551.1 ABC transporter ATP-binding protein [Rhodospirillaceae bacterium]MBT6911986.1 ABC transporter ATP-binding protein [Rhodospirillaceae bacterium]